MKTIHSGTSAGAFSSACTNKFQPAAAIKARLKRSRRRGVDVSILAAAAWGVALPAIPAKANSYDFSGITATNWNVASNWAELLGTLHLVPVNGDTAILGAGGQPALSVNFNETYTGAGLADLTIDAILVSTFTFYQTSASAMIATNELLGVTEFGNYYDQTAGSNTVSSTLMLGSLAASNVNVYSLSGTGTLSAGTEIIGNAGAGAFNQNGGANSISGVLELGGQAGGVGQYTLNALNTGTGNLSALDELIGYEGTGSFVQNAGTNADNGNVVIGDVGGSIGTYTLGGTGTLAAAGEALAEFDNGTTGTFIQSGSSYNDVTAGGNLNVGVGGMGVYLLQGGTLSVSMGGSEVIGSNNPGTGTFTQSNGSANNAAYLEIGIEAAPGFYNLQGGTLTATGEEEIGIGTFNQSGGTNNVNGGTLALGVSNGVNSVYLLSGGTLNAAAAALEIIGDNGSATFTQSVNSSNALTNGATLYVGYTAGSNGNYNLQNGSLEVTSGLEYVGFQSTGTFTQTGGTNTIVNMFSALRVGFAGGSNGFYFLEGGTLSVGGEESVGDGGAGTFTQSDGLNTLTQPDMYDLVIGTAHAGTYNLQGGTLSVTSDEVEGYGGNGTFNQSGGSHGVGQFLLLGDSGPGSYILSAGTLTAYTEYVGYQAATGTFNQSGGVNNLTGELDLAISTNAGGTYSLSGGTVSAPNVYVGGYGPLIFGPTAQGTGVFNVSNTGILNIGGTLGIFNTPGSAVNFSGGNINVGALDFNGDPSLFNWTGGTLQITGEMVFDPAAPPTSTFDAFGSFLSLNSGMNLFVGGEEFVGGLAPFTLVVNTGATDFSSGVLTVEPLGTLIQEGGTIGNIQNAGTYIFDGGSYIGNLSNSGIATFSLPFNASGGMTNTGNVSPIPLGVTLTLGASGLYNAGVVTLSGGGIAGEVTNQELISGYGAIGSLFDLFQNYGVITQSGGNLSLYFFALDNFGTINGANGLLLSLNSSSAVANDGTININGGIVSGAFPFTNNSDGVIEGPGNFFVNDFVNNGAIYVPSGTLNTSAVTNSGVIDLTAANAVIGPNGTITNLGILEGIGRVGAAVNNNGTIQPLGGQLVLSGTVTNSQIGLIAVDQGDNLLISSGLTNNYGIISLTGGVFDNGNQLLQNEGQISGYGTIRTSNLYNYGTMVLTGGPTTVDGGVFNSFILDLDYQPSTFTGAVYNYATIKTTGMTATFVGGLTNEVGSHYISDPSTNVFPGPLTNDGTMTGGTGDQYLLADASFTNAGTFTNLGLLSSTDAINNSGTFTQTGSLTQSANMTNSGSATIGGVQSWGVGTTFSNTAGNATFLTDAGSATASNLSVSVTGGLVTFAHSQHLAGLTVGSGGLADVVNNTLYINFGGPGNDPIASIVAALAQGYNGGAWTGTAGIISSSAAAALGTLPVLSIGYSDGNVDTGLGNSTQTSAVANQVLVKFTLAGDAFLDGVVNFNDLDVIGRHLNTSGNDWANGNFNYDPNGAVNFNDLDIVGQNLNKTLGNSDVSGGGTTVTLGETVEVQNTVTITPEPGSLALIAAGAGSLLARRRRNKKAAI